MGLALPSAAWTSRPKNVPAIPWGSLRPATATISYNQPPSERGITYTLLPPSDQVWKLLLLHLSYCIWFHRLLYPVHYWLHTVSPVCLVNSQCHNSVNTKLHIAVWLILLHNGDIIKSHARSGETKSQREQWVRWSHTADIQLFSLRCKKSALLFSRRTMKQNIFFQGAFSRK